MSHATMAQMIFVCKQRPRRQLISPSLMYMVMLVEDNKEQLTDKIKDLLCFNVTSTRIIYVSWKNTYHYLHKLKKTPKKKIHTRTHT